VFDEKYIMEKLNSHITIKQHKYTKYLTASVLFDQFLSIFVIIEITTKVVIIGGTA